MSGRFKFSIEIPALQINQFVKLIRRPSSQEGLLPIPVEIEFTFFQECEEIMPKIQDWLENKQKVSAVLATWTPLRPAGIGHLGSAKSEIIEQWLLDDVELKEAILIDDNLDCKILCGKYTYECMFKPLVKPPV